MKLVLCQHGQEFIDQYQPILLAHEVVYQLIMGNALANNATPCAPECFFGAITDDDGQPVLLFGHTAPYRLLIHSLQPGTIAEAVSLLAAFINEKQIDIAGILACEAICNEYLACDTVHTYQRGVSMDIMELRHANEITLSPGRFRQATEEDLALITTWHIAFQKEALGKLLDSESTHEKDKARLSAFYLYENPEGKICAMAAIPRILKQGCSVSLVYTDPAERGKGYCASLMHQIAKMQLAKGFEYLGLFVDKANPISNHTYKKVGYQILEDSVEYDIIHK